MTTYNEPGVTYNDSTLNYRGLNFGAFILGGFSRSIRRLAGKISRSA